VTNAEKILVSRHEDDLMLTDSVNATALVIRKVFGSQAVTHRHLQIKLEGSSSVISVDHLVKGFAKVGTTKDGLFELSWATQ
jgi:insecticidal toxin